MLNADDDDWTGFGEAAEEIARRIGCDADEARRRLREACAEGRIYSMKAPYEEDYDSVQILFAPLDEWTEIPFGEWRKRKVDHDGPDGFGRSTLVMLQQVQFDDWLDDETKPPVSDGSRDAVIRKLLEAGQRPPHSVSWTEFCVRVRNDANAWIDPKQDTYKRGFSRKQIQRVVDAIVGTNRTS
jgi:hypothetical protein